MAIGSRSGVVISTYLPPSEAALLRAREAAADRTVAAELRRVVRAHLSFAGHAAATNDPLGKARPGVSHARS
jgi:hypothetical protein